MLERATGVIEGACAHLVRDRFDITGARWSLEGAETMLKLRAVVRANGDWTYSKVRAITRVATPDSDADLAELARTATAAQLERIIRATAVAMADPAARAALRELHTSVDDEGFGVLRARVGIDELAVIDTAIAKALPEKDSSAEESVAQRRASALVRVCESYLATGDGARNPTDRNNAVVHVEVDHTGVTAAETDAGVPVHPDTARRLLCSCRVEGILGDLDTPQLLALPLG